MNTLYNNIKLIVFGNDLNVIFIKYLSISDFILVKQQNVNILLMFLLKPQLLGEWNFKIINNGVINFKINNKYLLKNTKSSVNEVSIIFNDYKKYAITILSKDQNIINTKIYFKPPKLNEYRLFTPKNTINLCNYLTIDDKINELNFDLLDNGYYSSIYDQFRLKHWNIFKEYLHVADLEEL